MAKRVLLIAIVVTVILVAAAPAMAFNGYRDNYDPTALCAACHTAGGSASSMPVFDTWSKTAHAVGGEAVSAARGLPYGSVCAGCHTANFAPGKVVPTPTVTSSTGTVSWAAANGLPVLGSTTDAAASEAGVGCSSCHYNRTAAHTATAVNPSNLANADICMQCHARYSYTVDTYTVAPVPYVKIVSGSPVPNPTPTTLIQPQMAIGFETMGDAANNWVPAPLSESLNVPYPGWSPTPNPLATSAAGLMTYWKFDGEDLPWTLKGHEGMATQYTDYKGSVSRHSVSLETLKASYGPNPPAACLKCHSTDYMIAPENAKPTGEQAKFGVTCVACHTPHNRGTATGVWSEEFTPQLRTDSQKALCVMCHTAELGASGVAAPGTTLHAPMREMMDGTGAIDVPSSGPSVHKGKCVQCHMVPTTINRGEVLLGANHTFQLVTPEVAAEVTPVPLRTTTPTPGASPVITYTTMPFSACTTCHSRPGDQAATWLQNTLDYRQEAMMSWNDKTTVALGAAAARLGFAGVDDAARIKNANDTLNAIAQAGGAWNASQTDFQKAFTNQSYVVSEGSWGIHNWDYARTIILKAMDQAAAVTAPSSIITIRASATTVNRNASVIFSGRVSTATSGTVTIQVRTGSSGAWRRATTRALTASGNYSVSIRMTTTGTFSYRATFPASATQRGGTSSTVTVRVR